jgi:hypothetical protein
MTAGAELPSSLTQARLTGSRRRWRGCISCASTERVRGAKGTAQCGGDTGAPAHFKRARQSSSAMGRRIMNATISPRCTTHNTTFTSPLDCGREVMTKNQRPASQVFQRIEVAMYFAILPPTEVGIPAASRCAPSRLTGHCASRFILRF